MTRLERHCPLRIGRARAGIPQDFLEIPARDSKCIEWPGGPEVADWWHRGGGLVAPRRLKSDKNLSNSALNLLGSTQDLLGPVKESQTSESVREIPQNAWKS